MLRPQPIGPVPDDTARVAHAAFPKGHPYLRLADECGVLFADDNKVIKVKFFAKKCGPCPSRPRCIRSGVKCQQRTLSLHTKEEYLALQEARQRERTEDFTQEYARRAGIEGTLSRGIRTCELRRTRYIGLARVHLGHIVTAAALNFLRLGEWIADVPRAKTRTSPFTLLMTDSAAA